MSSKCECLTGSSGRKFVLQVQTEVRFLWCYPGEITDLQLIVEKGQRGLLNHADHSGVVVTRGCVRFTVSGLYQKTAS